MKSMTGYGWGEYSRDGYKVTVELSAVNRRQCEVSIILPRELEVLEAQVRDEVMQRVARGRVTARITLHTSENPRAAKAQVNKVLAAAYTRELRRLAKELDLAGDVSIETLLRVPGVVQAQAESADAEAFWPAIQRALRKALAMLVEMREREGAHLLKDLTKRIRIMRRSAQRIRRHAPRVLKRFREQLLARIEKAGLEQIAPDDDRVLKEVVFFADRSDITEELTRLESHFNQFDHYAGSKEPVGRTLDFLAQEMYREINTIGSKANDSLISREVVTLKTELEKFREQVQNVE